MLTLMPFPVCLEVSRFPSDAGFKSVEKLSEPGNNSRSSTFGQQTDTVSSRSVEEKVNAVLWTGDTTVEHTREKLAQFLRETRENSRRILGLPPYRKNLLSMWSCHLKPVQAPRFLFLHRFPVRATATWITNAINPRLLRRYKR